MSEAYIVNVYVQGLELRIRPRARYRVSLRWETSVNGRVEEQSRDGQ